MRFKTDEHIPQSGVAVLRSPGHDIETVLDEERGGASDPMILAACRREARAFITLDKGLADIRAYPPAEYAGIAVLRPRVQRVATVVTLLRRMLALLETEPLAGALWIIDEHRVRIRR